MYNDAVTPDTETTGMERLDFRHSEKNERKRLFAQNLHRLRMAKGWNQSELAERAGLSRDLISKYANGKTLPTDDNLMRLAKALEVAETDLLPHFDPTRVDADAPAISLNPIPGRTGVYRLLVDAPVTLDLGVRIIGVLRGEAANG